MLPPDVVTAMECAGFEIGRRLASGTAQRVFLFCRPAPSSARPLRVRFTGLAVWALDLNR
jgi:hypothetical protein